MDKTQIATTLANTLNADADIRKGAESQLAVLEKTPGYHATLLEFVTVTEIPVDIRHAGILRLKNIAKRHWIKLPDEVAVISDADKQVIKENILETVIFQPVQQIRVQLVEICLCAVKGDFPEKWPGLLPSVMQNISSENPQRIYGGLSVLHTIFKKYAYKTDDVRGPLVDQTFPVLLQLLQSISGNLTAEALATQRILIKIFFIATQLSLPPYILKAENSTAWVTLMLKIMDTPLPKDQYPEDLDNLKDHPLWGAKKWVSRTFNRLFNRFANENRVTDALKPFAKMFLSQYAPMVLETFFRVLQQRAEGVPITDWVLQHTYYFIDMSVSHAFLFKLMKPHMKFILLESVLPTLCLNQKDLQLWEENPQEFVRKSLDIMEEFHDPRVAASNVLVAMVKIRTKYCLDMILTAVQQTLVEYQQNPDDLQIAIRKDAGLRVVGNLRKLLLKNENMKGPIEELLIHHVFGDFKSKYGFLRARAAWIIGQFSKMEWTNKEHYSFAVQAVCHSLSDNELPIKLEAALAISRLVMNEDVPQYIKPILPQLLEQYFRIIEEVGNEDVVETLSALIGQMEDEIAPYAEGICTRLVQMFMRLMQGDQEDDETALTAVQCLRAICALLCSLEKVPRLYPKMEETCAPLMDKMLCEDGIEFLDDILEMMTCFIFFGEGVSPFMWSLVPRIVTMFHDWAMDYMQNMLQPLDCIISKGTDVFLTCQNPNLLQMVLSMPKTLLEDPSKEEDAKYGCQLLETILSYCKGRIDPVVVDIIKLISQKLFVATNKQLKLLLCDVLGGCAFYNPVIFLETVKMGGPEFEQKLFGEWLRLLDDMTKVMKHQKIAVLGLGSLIQVPMANLPNLLRTSLGDVLNKIVQTLCTLKVAIDGEDDDEAESEEEEAVLDLNEDQDATEDMDDAFTFAQTLAQYTQEGGFDIDVDNQNYTSPLDDEDAFIFFAQSLEMFSNREGAFYQQWSANATLQPSLQLIMQQAQENRVKKEEEK